MMRSSPNIPEGAERVFEAESLFHAQTLVAVLADHDIEALAAPHIQHGTGVHPDAATGPIPVITRAADAAEARAILADVAANAQHIDWDSEIEHEAAAPQMRTGGMPLVARLGLIAGLLILGLIFIGMILTIVL